MGILETVKRGRLSPAASALMALLGVVTLLEVSIIVGAILIGLGIAMYVIYARMTRPRPDAASGQS